MSMRHSRARALFAGLASIPLALAAFRGEAAEWDTRASVAPAITYTDNVCLSQSNKQGDWIGTLTPSVGIQANGRKASAQLSGTVQLNSLTNSALNSKGCDGNRDEREQFSPSLRGKFNSVLIDNLMKLEVNARADQNEVTSRFAGGDDDFNRTGNRNTYYRYSVSPVVQRRFKDWVNLDARYTWDELFNSSDLVSDSYRHKFNMSLANAGPSKWSRKVQGSYTRVHYGESLNGLQRDDTELSSARVVLGYRLDRRWAVDGFYGREWNEFQTTLNGNRDGPGWGLNVNWTPTPRTAVSIGGGDRFFGNTPRVSIRHEHKRSSFRLNYEKRVTFERDLRTEDLGGFEDNINNASVFSNGPILDERLAGGWTYTGRSSVLSVNGNYSQQTRSEDGEQSVFKNVSATFSPQLSTRYNVAGSIAWSEDEPRGRINELPEFDDQANSESWTFNFSVGRQFNDRLNVSLSYLFTDRQGETGFNDYQENRITATFGIAL